MVKRAGESARRDLAQRAAAALALSVLVSCGCDDSLQFGLTLKVLSTMGEPICNATVRVTLGDFTGVLTPSPSAGGCHYTGLPEASGHFVATATAAGFLPSSISGDIGRDSCHVSGQALELRLEAN